MSILIFYIICVIVSYGFHVGFTYNYGGLFDMSKMRILSFMFSLFSPATLMVAWSIFGNDFFRHWKL